MITSAPLAKGKVGQPFSYQATANNAPTGFALTGALPEGLAFDPVSGLLSGNPTKPGAAKLPIQASNAIGAGVAIHDKVAVFGTGGIAGTSDLFQYALYAVNVSADGGSLRWRYPLQPGEKVWATPVLDAFGNTIFAAAANYLSPTRTDGQPTTGRLVAVDRDGAESSSRETTAATVGRVIVSPGVILSVDMRGEVTQFGTAGRPIEPNTGRGSVRILSWRPL